jgi:pimeloyl-ACP methyl ester carboxylesterase
MKLQRALLTTGLVVGSIFGTLTIANKLTESMAGELNTILTGEERRYPWKYGDMFYEVKGERGSKPLLLIHSFAPGASSYEWRRNIDTLARQFRVYVIDLLGFGLSDRPAMDYTPETFSDLISDFVREVIGKPTIVVAHGMSCAYVVADAYRNPQFFERLVLVAPPATMLEEQTPEPLNTAFKFVLRIPILGQFIYGLLTSRSALRSYYDREGFHNPGLITDDFIEYVYTSAHQPNSRYAAASYISNNLTPDVYEAFARLQMPVVIVLGREGAIPPDETSKAFQRVNSRAEVRILDKSNQQLQDEQSAKFNQLVGEFTGAAVS